MASWSGRSSGDLRGARRRRFRTSAWTRKSFRKRHRYVTVVSDIDRGRVLYVAEDRKQKSLDGFWPTLTEEQLASIEGVAMDMWEPYINSTKEHLPEADEKIVFDKFHVAKHLGEGGRQSATRRRTSNCARPGTIGWWEPSTTGSRDATSSTRKAGEPSAVFAAAT